MKKYIYHEELFFIISVALKRVLRRPLHIKFIISDKRKKIKLPYQSMLRLQKKKLWETLNRKLKNYRDKTGNSYLNIINYD